MEKSKITLRKKSFFGNSLTESIQKELNNKKQDNTQIKNEINNEERLYNSIITSCGDNMPHYYCINNYTLLLTVLNEISCLHEKIDNIEKKIFNTGEQIIRDVNITTAQLLKKQQQSITEC